jgi:hypothetical protein
MIAVLDTNVYVSALVFGGNPRRIVRLAEEEQLSVAISLPLLAELAEILSVKFGWAKSQIEDVLRTVGSAMRTGGGGEVDCHRRPPSACHGSVAVYQNPDSGIVFGGMEAVADSRRVAEGGGFCEKRHARATGIAPRASGE